MRSRERKAGARAMDVCIVGAGPVGLALALKLEELGLTAALVEMGLEQKGSGQPGLEAGAGGIEFVSRHHASSAAISRPGLGGASALWGGRCVAFDDLDFEIRDHVPYSGWPIAHDTVRRHYSQALAFLNCGVAQAESHAGSDDTISTEAFEYWSSQADLGPLHAEHLRRSQHISLRHGMVTGIVLDPSAKRVQHLVVFQDGEETHIEADIFVLAGGGLENARLLLSLQREHPEALGAAEAPLGRFYQGHLTGYIAVVQFDQPETAKRFALQTDEQGHVLRRRLQIAPRVQADERLLNCVFWMDAMSIADPAHGSGALSLIYLFLKTFGLYRRLSDGLAPTVKGLRNVGSRDHWSNFRRDRMALRDIPGALCNVMERRVNRMRTLINPKGRYLLRYHSEQAPNPQSRVMLRQKDGGSGQSVLAVDYRVADQDLSSVLKSHEILDGWLRETGLGRLDYLHDEEARRQAVLDQAFDGYHQIGLTRMSDDPARGVADADCRVHGLGNLYLAGSCLFPTGGQANPTLPAVALALRLAHHLARNVRR